VPFIDFNTEQTMKTERQEHWERVWGGRAVDAVSWFQPRAERSMELIAATDVELSVPIIDVGAGASIFVDELLAAGYGNLTVLDISGAALDAARKRLGPEAAGSVTWIEADVTRAGLPEGGYDLWHDRAVFHFLTAPEDRASYLEAMQRALRPGGWVVMATFADDGPERCSGLPVVRYCPESLAAELGSGFTLVRHIRDEHTTPSGACQRFIWCLFRMRLTAATSALSPGATGSSGFC
jgi:SAM-dependent methyltransferase